MFNRKSSYALNKKDPKVAPITRSSRWSSGLPLSGYASRMPTKR